jgi:hypothetical protein
VAAAPDFLREKWIVKILYTGYPFLTGLIGLYHLIKNDEDVFDTIHRNLMVVVSNLILVVILAAIKYITL